MSSRSLVCAALAAACASHAPEPHEAARPTPPRVRITFVPQADSFATAAQSYERLWAADGPRVVATMERVSGLSFATPSYGDTAIVAQVLEQPSYSGYRDAPMRLRASYAPDTKRATLVHELGHRLQGALFGASEEEHVPLFYWLYDVWVALYGRPFADAQVLVERGRGGVYPAAWDSALTLTAEQRAARWRAIRDERLRRVR